MADKPTSPFAGLDKALLRSTKQSPTAPPQQTSQRPANPQKTDTVTPRYHDTTVSAMQPRTHDTMIPQDEGDIFDVVRKAVKQIGKEAATHRFTLDEKSLLADIEYTYKRRGIRTSETEITRIAINYFLEDYRRHGESSLLATVLKRLNS
jgi:carboxylesterase type B